MVEEEQEFEEAVEIIGLVEGTVKDMKKYVRNNDLEQEKLRKLLEVEKDSNNRKTAVEFLEKRIEDEKTEAIEVFEEEETDEKTEEPDSGEREEEEKEDEQDSPDQETEVEPEEIETDTEIDKETLLQLLGGTVEDVKRYVKENEPSDQELQEILHAEKTVKDRKTVVKFLKSYSKKKELEEDFRQAEYDFKQMKEDLQKIEEDVMEESVELDLDSVEVPETDPEEPDEKDSEDEAENEEESEEPEEEENEKSGEEKEDDIDENDKSDSEEEEKVDEDSEPSDEEKKKQLVEELGLDMDEEELKAVSLESLERIKEEKEEREELIDDLKDNFDEEKLRNASTSDLRKLKEGLSQKERDEEEKTEEKEDEEIREEAEEDLEMLMGAVKSKNSDGSEDEGMVADLKSSIDDTKQRFNSLLKRGADEEDEEDGIRNEEVLELLEQYRELGPKESSIKTAHVMKGYLEYKMDIEREMTYKELADELKEKDVRSESMEELLDFFYTMNKAEYTGNISSEVEEVIDVAEQTVKELS